MLKAFLLSCSLCCLTAVAFAEDPVETPDCPESSDLSEQFSHCVENSDGATASIIECIGAEYKQQDERLNKAYKTLMSEVSPERQKQLKTAQRAWISFRDANCAFYDDPEGGTLARISANDCMMTTTAKRATELESFLEGFGE